MSAADQLRAEAATHILIKDGPYGTGIQAEKLDAAAYCAGLDLMKDQKGNNDLLNITQPGVIRSICERYTDAGAQILATNTFNANRISQADYGAEDLSAAINRAAARIIREVADRYSAADGKARWVADLRGRVAAKTGYIGGVNSLSGYLTLRDGRELIFVIIGNGEAAQADRLRAIDDVVRAIAAEDAP